MHFGEFLKANLIEGLEDGYLDYGMLVACVEQRSGRHSIDDDNLKIGTTAMPLSTSSSLGKQVKRVVSAVLTWIVLTILWIKSWVCCCCGKGNSDGENVEPLLDSVSILDDAEDEATRKEKHDQFLAAMLSELSRCNFFLAHKEAELESSIRSLIQTVNNITGTKAGPPSPRVSFTNLSPVPYGQRRVSDPNSDHGVQDHEDEHEQTSPVVSDTRSPRTSFTDDVPQIRRTSGLSDAESFPGPQSPPRTPSRRNSESKLRTYKAPQPLFQAIWSQPDTIEHAYREMHVHIMQLKQVATLNLTGFQKAAKKCKKKTRLTAKACFKEEVCCKSEKMDELADLLARSYAMHFTENNIDKARSKLMVYKASLKPSLKVGFFLGFDVALTLALIWVTTYHPARTDCPFCSTSMIEVIPVYRVIFFPILFIWGWSVLVYLWRSYGINYLWILDMDPKHELGIHGSASLAATMTSFWLISLLLYTATVKTGYSLLDLPLYVWPLTLFLVMFLACIAPSGAFYFKSRKWFFQTLTIIFQRVIAFIGPEVRFRENYVADVLTSMVAWIVDFENTVLYYVSGSGFHPGESSLHPKHVLTAHILTGIPYYYRVQECIRRYYDTQDKWQLVNCGKYLTSLSAICLASLGNYVKVDGHWSVGKAVWFTMLIVSTLYCYCWDIACDWGYITRKGIRKQIGFINARWFYVFACITNFIGRIAWAFTITPYSIIPGLGAQTTKTIAGTIEILRRCQWTLLRVEYEYMANPNKYRSIKQVPILLTFENETEQIHPMRATIVAGGNLVIVAIVVIVATIHFSHLPHET
ncbi:SPX and EXS domain-containing protein [Chloropicon primus]|uniref:EXS domain-containing protein n=1 Tax=Chloropicon primus TaxID=1764295 RepID=A0A5B8MNH1_9CHLO|nr:hypothetical protein A3770_07p47360 [Chloropicon primus]UPR01436.1 SPX and EXS domain-containing protein [Chloropicon primus]|mmetsp:Transcript_8446/g.24137  ORF Transcript_8446/g.24137 Transcript_8446/m.24137 type:complete len:810 (-) Transcript_8446:71-2500(-)|eukprot:QDZ22218.1 hypothetical protein A3770_07p47360 [Chloropicon primus]